ncbi:restriction endonuclease subunit S [bacterium]|nr:restriction endonuclease subunit S [bacterium]
MKSVWQKVRLGDICEVIPGFAFKSKDFQDTGIPVVKIKNIRDDHTVDLIDVDCVPGEILNDKTKRFLLQNGDILVAMTGATAGKVGKVRTQKPVLLNQRVAKIKPVKADPQFVWSVVSSDQYESLFYKLADGAAQPNMSGSQIEDVELLLPTIGTQRKIAAILSAYDDLIENNTRRIKILEEMAQMIYREWFVHFRFPGHEKVKMVDSPLGKIPEGWEVSKIEDLYNTASGGTPSRKIESYFNGSINWIKTQELQDGFIFETDEKITEAGLQNSSAKVFPVNSVIIAMYGATIGKLGILAQPASTNQACCALLQKHKTFGHAYGFLTLLERRKDIIGLRMGAAQQNISQVVIKNFQILNPNEQILEYFNDIVNPMFDLIRDLQRKNQILRRTRDLLLPKLISGEVEVENIEVRVPSKEMG